MKELRISNVLDKHLSPIEINGVQTPIELSTEAIRISEEITFKKDVTFDESIIMKGGGYTTGIYLSGDVDLTSNTTSGVLNLVATSMFMSSANALTEETFVLAVGSSTGYDPSIYFLEGSSGRFRIGVDVDDSNKLKFDSGTATVGAATKLTLDSSGNLTASNSLVVGNTTLTAGELDYSGGDTLLIDSAGVIRLDCANKTDFLLNGTMFGRFNVDGATLFTLFEQGGASEVDYLRFTVATNGATTIATTDAAGREADLKLQADGNIELEPCSADARDSFVLIDGAAGFTQLTTTFSDTSLIGSGGTDDTDIDFRTTNKRYMLVTGDITNLNLIFPRVSGNFLLYLRYDGDHDITNYKVYEHDLSASNGDADVEWAGGSAPATTDSGKDIFTFYWDYESEVAFGVASLAFAS